MELISVIIPVFNVENFVGDCIKSIITQTYNNIEIIIVDDGSTDQSIRKIEEIIGDDCRVIILHKVNGGLSSARNYGIKESKGEYITFIDSDDTVERDYLESLYSKIQENDIVCCGYNLIDENNIFLKKVENIKLPPSCNIRKEVIRSIEFIPSAWGKLYRRDIFKTIRYPEGVYFEDLHIINEICDNRKISILDDCLYNYRVRKSSIMRSFNEKTIEDKALLFNNLRGKLIDKGVYIEYENEFKESYLYHMVFVTACIIISQLGLDSISFIKKIKENDLDKDIFNFKSITQSRISIGTKAFLFLMIISNSAPVYLKLIQNKLKEIRN